MERFRDRKRFVHPATGFEAAIHKFGLPFHEGKSAFGVRAFPFVEKVPSVNLRSRISTGLVRSERARNSGQHNLRRGQIDRIFPTRNPNEIFETANLAIGGSSIEKHAVVAGIAK